MQYEIERKYHLRHFPKMKRRHLGPRDGAVDETNRNSYLTSDPRMKELDVQTVQHMDQTYLALDADEEIRIRKIVDEHSAEVKYTHTFKKGLGMSRKEVEYEISREIYKQLLAMSGAVPLRKTRTILTDGKTVFELDTYEQFDLQVVEVEFESEQEAAAFNPPAWFGEEIHPGEEKSNKKMWQDLQSEQ